MSLIFLYRLLNFIWRKNSFAEVSKNLTRTHRKKRLFLNRNVLNVYKQKIL